MEMMLVPAPKLRPFLCLDGTSGGSQPVVDTLITTRTPGRVYLSAKDVRNAARLYGFRDPEQVQADMEHLAELAAEIDKRDLRIAELEGELAELKDVRAAITRASERWQIDEAA